MCWAKHEYMNIAYNPHQRSRYSSADKIVIYFSCSVNVSMIRYYILVKKEAPVTTAWFKSFDFLPERAHIVHVDI